MVSMDKKLSRRNSECTVLNEWSVEMQMGQKARKWGGVRLVCMKLLILLKAICINSLLIILTGLKEWPK